MNDTPRFRRPPKAPRSTDPRYITLYLGPATKEALKAVDAYPGTGNGEMTRAARINAICERYALFLPMNTPSLSEAEWCGLMAIFQGGFSPKLFEDLAQDEKGLFKHVQVAHAAGAASEWEYNRKDLENTLVELSDDYLYGVAEVADRFWASDLDDGRTPRQRLKECGAKIFP